jgi:L-iditol 2-dehydrogenase
VAHNGSSSIVINTRSNSSDMKALRRKGPDHIELINADDPHPSAQEVIVRVSHVGICGSDVHRLHEDNPKWDSIFLGHEFSGVVACCGSAVANISEGQRVAVAPLVPCHECDLCAEGHFSQCPHYSFIGSRRNGAFAEFVNVPAKNVIPISDSLSLKRAALLEPLTVVLHPLMMVGNQFGALETVVVTGLGAIGLLAVQVFKFLGARNIVVSDMVDAKLNLALELGATHAVNVTRQRIEDVTDPLGGAWMVFESSGATPAKQAAVRVARSRGTILLVGTSPRDVTFEASLFERISRKELCLLGSWMNYSAPWPGREWKMACQLLEGGHIADSKLVTHELDLSDGQRAVDIVTKNTEPFIKVMFHGV